MFHAGGIILLKVFYKGSQGPIITSHNGESDCEQVGHTGCGSYPWRTDHKDSVLCETAKGYGGRL